MDKFTIKTTQDVIDAASSIGIEIPDEKTAQLFLEYMQRHEIRTLENDMFEFVATYGFPLEIIEEEFEKLGIIYNKEKYNLLWDDHRKISMYINRKLKMADSSNG